MITAYWIGLTAKVSCSSIFGNLLKRNKVSGAFPSISVTDTFALASTSQMSLAATLAVSLPIALPSRATEEAVKQRVSAIFVNLREPVFRFVVSYVGSGEAEEITQEVFLRLYRCLRTGQDIDDRRVRSWCFTVARNLALKGRRRYKHEPPQFSSLWDGLKDSVPTKGPSTEERFMWEERVRAVECAMESLTHLQSECLRLRGEGLSYKEIAEALSVSFWGVADALARALRNLRKRVHASPQ